MVLRISTYIWTEEGFVYLTSVMDLYSRKIVGGVMNSKYGRPQKVLDV